MSSFKIKIVYYDTGSVSESVPIESYFGKGFSTNYQISIGVNVYVKDYEYGPHDTATLSFWDVGEQEKFKFFRKSLLKGALGAVLVFDLSSKASFEEVKGILNDAREITSKTIPFVLIGNKTSGQSSIEKIDITSYVKKEGGIYLETSTQIKEQLNKALIELTREIIEHFVLIH